MCYDWSICRPWLTVWSSNFKSLFELKSFPFEPRDHIVNILKTCFLGPYFKLWKLVFFPSNLWSVYVVLVLKTWPIINGMDLWFCQYKVFSHWSGGKFLLPCFSFFLCLDENKSAANHELLPMSHVLSHILDSAEPLVQVRNWVS